MEIYLDNGATTRVFDSVKDKMITVLSNDYGNPSSLHNKGFYAEQYIKEAREIIANSLKVEAKEVIFTSGGTEANNLALIGVANANKRRGNHIITTRIEHSSVNEPLKHLMNNGFEVDFCSVDKYGNLIINELIELIRDDTVLISIIYVNNEIGTIQDLSTIINKIKEAKQDIIIHVDAIQAYGKININPKKLGIDLLSISAHKINGPKGIGALFINNKTRINPIIFGGGQELNIRSGTENVPAIAGFGQAVIETFDNMDTKINNIYKIKKYFIEKVLLIDGTSINGIEFTDTINEIEVKKTAPHIVSVSFRGVRNEVLLHSLAEKSIYVSSGSACSSNQPQRSSTLVSIGLDNELLSSTLRFSFSDETLIEDINYTLEEIKKILPILRRYQAK
ncbi:MAG TPA: cysteine desulfurase [Clostridiales bacterium]|nr:cysteine desulfurase [Clostridiales bacterium]